VNTQPQTRVPHRRRAAARWGNAIRFFLRPISTTIVSALLLLALTGCTVGPNYHKPDAPSAPAFKEDADVTPPPNPPNGGWKRAQPGDDKLRGKWWEIYGDPQLDKLEETIAVSNQTLKAQCEQYRAAVDIVKEDRASYFPTLSVSPSFARTKLSPNQPNFNAATERQQYDNYIAAGQASWEPDLWGSVRRTVEGARATAQATAADLANVDLSLHAELAMDYFEMRGLDTQQKLLQTTVDEYQRYLELTQIRFKGGVATDADVALAQTQLDQTKAQLIDVGVARAQYEHAIATLTGVPASSFGLPATPLVLKLPDVPVGVPSEILERRPDVAGAERRADAANAQIGVAIAAFYPTVSLTGNGGFQSVNGGTLFQGPSNLWSLGASATELLFDAGRRKAVTDQARATYDAQVANYRQTVLQAFQDVEDQLAALRILNQESSAQDLAVRDSERSLAISTRQYKEGLQNYLTVITAQATELANQRTAADITTRQFSSSVQLVKALGGGWDASQLPKQP
jgi:NodT family efflux transporter outer membrane factor (OMF) lipoprotein